MMIEKGADINAQTRNGITPLHACSETGVLEIVDLLLSSGASVNLTDAYVLALHILRPPFIIIIYAYNIIIFY